MIFPRYVVVSALSLAADWLCLVILTGHGHVEPGLAAALAYVAGGVINYGLSRRFVFPRATTRSRRLREAVLFAASCALGTMSTGAIVWMLTPSITPLLAKLVATVVTFVLIYWCRRLVVFDPDASLRSATGSLQR